MMYLETLGTERINVGWRPIYGSKAVPTGNRELGGTLEPGQTARKQPDRLQTGFLRVPGSVPCPPASLQMQHHPCRVAQPQIAAIRTGTARSHPSLSVLEAQLPGPDREKRSGLNSGSHHGAHDEGGGSSVARRRLGTTSGRELNSPRQRILVRSGQAITLNRSRVEQAGRSSSFTVQRCCSATCLAWTPRRRRMAGCPTTPAANISLGRTH